MSRAPDQSWKRMIIPVYGPTFLVSIGLGAIYPLVALTARNLGADIGTAALMVGLMGLGQLLGDLPAGALAQRIGEKRAMTLAGVIDVAALTTAWFAQSLALFALAVLVTGLAAAVFGLARHAYLTEAVPLHARARALSALGGTSRVGMFIGPFISAGLLLIFEMQVAYAFAAGTGVAATILTLAMPALPGADTHDRSTGPRRRLGQVLWEHRRVLVILGAGVLVLSAVRSARQGLVPLWCESLGFDASTTSVIYGISAGVDMLMFLPGGAMMDRFGRVWGVLPALIIVGLGFVLLPLGQTPLQVTVLASLLGLGNGLSSGIVLTLGSDNAPVEGRSQFLGGWRVAADLGNTAGPLVISLITVFAPLAAASVAIGVVGWLGAGWLARWIPHFGSPPGRTRRT
ncbi:MAG: MFS transporter [Propionibacteriales bacterium]|nr:MFS transporter [Propionibacteriales bacterium]